MQNNTFLNVKWSAGDSMERDHTDQVVFNVLQIHNKFFEHFVLKQQLSNHVCKLFICKVTVYSWVTGGAWRLAEVNQMQFLINVVENLHTWGFAFEMLWHFEGLGRLTSHLTGQFGVGLCGKADGKFNILPVEDIFFNNLSLV